MAKNLIGAAMENDLVAVDRLLLVHGVPASIARGSLWEGFMTPLIAAAMRGNYKVVEKLLHADAEVNWRDEEGNSALDFAYARQSNPRMWNGKSQLDEDADVGRTIKLLIQGGATPSINDCYDY
jgi:ankyrin repeat protein